MALLLPALVVPAEEKHFQIKLPFPPGSRYKVLQGNHGRFSHKAPWEQYAWDFDMPLRSPITAVAAGRVVDVKGDSDQGGKYRKFQDDGNYVEIDHGSGLFSQYLHVWPRSVRVRVGDAVTAGQVIAASGNNGFSTAPHLHLNIVDYLGHSRPAVFEDFPAHRGVPREGEDCLSGRLRGEGGSPSGESLLPADVFARNGIRLTSRLPARLWRPREEYRVAGRCQGRGKEVVLFVMSHKGGKVLREYKGRLDGRGRFDFKIDFLAPSPEDRWDKTPHLFTLAMALVKRDGSYASSFSVPITVYRE